MGKHMGNLQGTKISQNVHVTCIMVIPLISLQYFLVFALYMT